jgi:aldose 1-epimerase
MNTQTEEFYAFIPEFGGLVYEIGLKSGKNVLQVLDNELSEADILRNQWFKSCKLTPFPNRINRGEYNFGESTYNLPINSPEKIHSIHGFVYNRPFELIDINKDTGKVELRYSYTGNFPGYPFYFDINLIYVLGDQGFSCTTRVNNNSNLSMPFGDGWHPYFRIGEKADDWNLELPDCYQILTDDVMIPTGEIISSNKLAKRYQLRNKDFDTGFGIVNPDQTAATSIFLNNPADGITLEVRQQTGTGKYNFFQVFIPPSRKSVAIEPMSCMADAFNNLSGLIVLEPDQYFEGEYLVRLR